MNATNRAANRLFLLIIGILLIVAATASALIAVLPAFARGWTSWFTTTPTTFEWALSPVVGKVGWFAIALAVVSIIIGILLIMFIVRQGQGHTAAVIENRTEGNGRVRLDLAIPRTLLSDYLAELPDVLASRVTAYDVRGTATLKVSVRARRGVSPKTISDEVIRALHALDAVLGQEIPAYVQISGGFRARTAARARVA